MVLPIKGENYNLVSMAFYLGFMIFGASRQETPCGYALYIAG